MMKRILLPLFMLSAAHDYGGHCSAHTDAGHNRVLVATYPVKPVARWQGDSLALSFVCELEGRLQNPLSMHIAPFYISGRDTLRYPPINCFTPSGAKFRNRRSSIQGADVAGHNIVIRNNVNESLQYRYEESLVVPRSSDGELRILHYVQDCCDTWRLDEFKVDLSAGEPVVAPKKEVRTEPVSVPDTVYRAVEVVQYGLPLPVAAVSVPLFETNVTFVRPRTEAVKKRSASVDIRINYPVNHWRVDASYKNNYLELNRVHEILSSVNADRDAYTVSAITIYGYASPEAPYYHNLELTQKRAEGMKEYLLKRYSLSGCHIQSIGMGEDWDGLRKAVADSPMAAKHEILAIIDNYGIFNSREKHLTELYGGGPYRYLLQHYFPALRRMEMKIDYTVKAFSTREAGDLIDDRPQDLSHEEIFSLARVQNNDRTIKRHRDEYGKEYDVAVRYYPDNAAANINAASAALVRGDLELAWQYLSKVQDNPQAYNNIGVYCWLCGKIADARNYFYKAMEADPKRAAYNLRQLDKWREQFMHDHDPPKN